MSDQDVHPGGPRTRGESPQKQPGDERFRLRLIAIAAVDEHEPEQRGDERGDERQQDDRHGGIPFACLRMSPAPSAAPPTQPASGTGFGIPAGGGMRPSRVYRT